jgi:Lipase (class 3)
MQQCAINDLFSLPHKLPSPAKNDDPVVRYICALFSELAYYHIPRWEIDDKKRAKLVPCETYKILINKGTSINVNGFIREFDLPIRFVVEERGVVAIGMLLNRILFIGFRGTQFLFDWETNLRSRLVALNYDDHERFPCGISSGGFHSGFAEEAMRVSLKISDEIGKFKGDEFDQIFLTGHSLGGAVAAIATHFIGREHKTSICNFGAPRYCDISAYNIRRKSLPVQIRRPGDMVPTVPPKIFGFVDHPYEFGTDGNPYISDPSSFSFVMKDIWHWLSFLVGRFESHSMEAYRREVGVTAGAPGACLPFLSIEKLTLSDIASHATA